MSRDPEILSSVIGRVKRTRPPQILISHWSVCAAAGEDDKQPCSSQNYSQELVVSQDVQGEAEGRCDAWPVLTT